VVVCSLGGGELGWERRRNRRGEGRQNGDILTLTEGIADGILLSMISSFVGDSLGNFDGELITSLYGDSNLNPSVISSVKSPPKATTSSNYFF
jgi:hypothetical protein